MATTSFPSSTRKNPSAFWQWLLIGGLFLLMLIVSALIAQPTLQRPYDLESTDADGLLALSLWFEELGYDVAEIGQSNFELSNRDGHAADLLFIYPNAQTYTEEEATKVAEWVESGGTLALIGPTSDDFALIERFGVAPVPAVSITFSQEYPRQPLLPRPADGWSTSISRAALDLSDAPNAVPVLTKTEDSLTLTGDDEKRVTVAIQPLGQGQIWHLSPSHALTNQALDVENDGYILPALLRDVPDGGRVLFDTYHLYGSTSRATDGAPSSLRGWLYQTNIGRAVLLCVLLLFGYLLLQGIRLGPPLPLREEMIRREAAEYVVAMAGLQRRLGEPAHVADYQRRYLKQHLGNSLAIPSTLSDQEFMEEWKSRSTHLDQETIHTVSEILEKLSHSPTEQTLVEMAAKIDEQLGKH